MSLHSCRRLRRGGRRAVPVGLLLALCFVAGSCGSGAGGLAPLPAGLDLPVVGTAGRAPLGPSVIHVTVDADGRISHEGDGPLSLLALRDRFQLATADPAWREPDRSSAKILHLDADAALPWVVPCWIMMVACEPQIGLYKVFLGTRSSTDGARGAIGWTLPRARSLPRWDGADPPLWLRARLTLHDGSRGDPETVAGPVLAAAAAHPEGWVVVDVRAASPDGAGIPTGYVAEVVDAALRAGARRIRFQGLPLPGKAERQDPDEPPWFALDDVEGLLRYVAWWEARPGEPTLEVRGLRTGIAPTTALAPPGRGVLPRLYGSEVPSTEPEPSSGTGAGARRDVADEEIVDEEIVEPALVEPMPDAWFTDAAPPRRDDMPERGREPDAVEKALAWLAAHQAPNGGWEVETYERWCDGKPARGWDVPVARDPGPHDVGVTGLALSAFLGAGYTNRGRHPFAKTVSKGLRYLKNVQDAEGCFGPRNRPGFLQDHAAAAQAMLEAYRWTESPIFKGSAQKALDFLLLARRPGGGWGASLEGTDEDLATTLWMTLPLVSARLANAKNVAHDRPPRLLLPDEEILVAEIRRTLGEAAPLGTPVPTGLLDPASAEGLVAGALLARRLLDPEAPLPARLPGGPPTSGPFDPVSWFFGTFAAFELGGETWKAWSTALQAAVVATQRADTDPCQVLGSWDPLGPGPGGRVATTALLAMCLEVHYRYAHVPFAR